MGNNTPYYIVGKSFTENDLIQYCKQKLADNGTKEFEKDIFQFILDWFSSADYMVVKTSGSTGNPKEIRLQKKHMEASARATISFFDLKPKDKILHCLPMHFIAGKMMVVRVLVGSLDLYCIEPSSELELIPEQIDFAAMIPFQVSKLVSKEEGRSTLSKIEKLIIGG